MSLGKGISGEEIAINYLKSMGYRIIKTNFHFSKYGEIDIICEKGSLIVFVEVKLRYSLNYGAPEQSINYSKQQHIRRAAEGYIYINKIENKEFRIDFIGIDLSESIPKINHIECAF